MRSGLLGSRRRLVLAAVVLVVALAVLAVVLPYVGGDHGLSPLG